MKKNNIIWVKINCDNYYKILVKLNSIGISLYDSKIIDDFIIVKTNYEEYLKIKKYLVSYDISIFEITGFAKMKQFFKKYIIFTIASIISILFLFFVNNLIFKIDVKTNNDDIRNLVLDELNKHGLKTLKLKINHKKIEKLVKVILDDNKDTLEWLEIEYDGLIMNVYVTEKVVPSKNVQHSFCHIVASTDAKISNMNIYRGVALKEINDYVLKGDIILSGEISFNNEIKNNVCASGEIYGEVWYKVKVTVPFLENYIEYTGKNRYNFNIKINDNKYNILKSRIKNKKLEEINLYRLNDFEINLVKEKEFIEKTRTLSEDEAYKKAINLALEKINLKLDENEEVLLKKVLKKEINDSTIYLEIFIVTKENIGELKIVEEDIKNDSNNKSNIL